MARVATKIAPSTPQNAAIADYLRSIGQDPDKVLGDTPSVEGLLAQQDGLFSFEGEVPDASIGRLSQVWTEEQVRDLSYKGFVRVPDGKITVKGLPGGHIMFRPALAEAKYRAARKVRVDGFRPRKAYTENLDQAGEYETHTPVHVEHADSGRQE